MRARCHERHIGPPLACKNQGCAAAPQSRACSRPRAPSAFSLQPLDRVVLAGLSSALLRRRVWCLARGMQLRQRAAAAASSLHPAPQHHRPARCAPAPSARAATRCSASASPPPRLHVRYAPVSSAAPPPLPAAPPLWPQLPQWAPSPCARLAVRHRGGRLRPGMPPAGAARAWLVSANGVSYSSLSTGGSEQIGFVLNTKGIPYRNS